jgi:2-dehydropantoate 2-reductase
VGGFYGGKLAQAGACVAALCRSDYDTVRTSGIAVTSDRGDFLFQPEQVVRTVSEYGPPPDFVLVALKVLPEIDTAGIIRGALGPGTAIVLVQNGIDIEEPVARAFPAHEIISGLAFVCLTRTAPGRIHHLDYGRLVMGRYPAGTSARTEQLARLFTAAEVPCEVTEDVVGARWRKLVWNAPFNPISVLGGGVDTKTMMEHPDAARLAREVMEEVRRIAAAAGHPLPEHVVERNLEDTRLMRPYETSMLVDFRAERPLEIEAILGNALRTARRHGVRAPHLESLYALLALRQQQGRRERSH